MSSTNVRVQHVLPWPGFKLRVQFTNGATGVVDVSAYWEYGPSRWKSFDDFRQVQITQEGNLRWSGDIQLNAADLFSIIRGEKSDPLIFGISPAGRDIWSVNTHPWQQILTALLEHKINIKRAAYFHPKFRPILTSKDGKFSKFTEPKPILYSEAMESAKTRYIEKAHACPICDRPPSNLTWFFYQKSEAYGAEDGWMTACESCRLQVDYYLGFSMVV